MEVLDNLIYLTKEQILALASYVSTMDIGCEIHGNASDQTPIDVVSVLAIDSATMGFMRINKDGTNHGWDY